jgi:DNA-binding NtrC family response regulator
VHTLRTKQLASPEQSVVRIDTDHEAIAMKKPPASELTSPSSARQATATPTVLFVGALDDDRSRLEQILGAPAWVVIATHDLASAVAVLQEHEIAVVLCERYLQPGTYVDMLEHINVLADPPSLIVTSRLADEHLWAEALNLGAWDVLATPFDGTEALRSIHLAWQHWHQRGELQAKPAKGKMAATGM